MQRIPVFNHNYSSSLPFNIIVHVLLPLKTILSTVLPYTLAAVGNLRIAPLLNHLHVLSLFIDGYLKFPKLPHPAMVDTPTFFRSYFPNCAAVAAPLQDIASAVVLLYNFQVW